VIQLVLAYLGGILTIMSPCILPVLPFVFSRADQSFRKDGLPLLAGMAVAFASIATIATVSGGWAIRANQYGRAIALMVFGIFAVTLVWPTLAERLSRPFVRLGGRLSGSTSSHSSPRQSFELGLATGLLWAPCAGPILGLILTEAALEGASVHTSLLLLSYALGAASSLALVLLTGSRVFHALKRSLGAEVWIRRGLGIAVLLGVAAVALGADRGILTRLSLASTSGVEQKLVDRLHRQPAALGEASVSGAVAWFNSPPLTSGSLKGKVVVYDFWTYSCINCLRTLPYLRAWADKYRASGLVVIGVHTPEFSFERDLPNVEKAVRDLAITYPVAVDNNYAIWKTFNNAAWPANYVIDAAGHIRYHQLGEGQYKECEQVIQELLQERNGASAPGGFVNASGDRAEAPADSKNIQSPDTPIGNVQNLSSSGVSAPDGSRMYTTPSHPGLNQWGLAGRWKLEGEKAVLVDTHGSMIFRFHARDLHLVLGERGDKPVRFRVRLDGEVPGENHGADTDDQGFGTVAGHRLYQLIRQQKSIQDRTFEIEFFDSGIQAFSFTFG
jgi:cytochrome c biogenesis protein CcdA/thiol-disulfide isomerase/thioredoxin